jgi:hypothetical protein
VVGEAKKKRHMPHHSPLPLPHLQLVSEACDDSVTNMNKKSVVLVTGNLFREEARSDARLETSSDHETWSSILSPLQFPWRGECEAVCSHNQSLSVDAVG